MTTSSGAQLTALLRRAGLRATAATRDLMRVLARQKRPQSVATLRSALRPIPAVTTVYRLLERFVDAGLAVRVDLQHSHAHYELVPDDDHHHVVCTRCGRIADITGCNVEALAQAARRSAHFATITHHAIELFGVCERCAHAGS